MTAPAATTPPTLDQLWAQAHALLDARCEPLAEPDFADAWSDALGAALAADDDRALAELDALATTLARLAAAPAVPAPQAAQRRTPWLALTAGLAAAAATLALTSDFWRPAAPAPVGGAGPASHASSLANPSSSALAQNIPGGAAPTPAHPGTEPLQVATSDALQPAPPRVRIAIKSLDRSSVRTPFAAATGRATLKSLTTTTRHTR